MWGVNKAAVRLSAIESFLQKNKHNIRTYIHHSIICMTIYIPL